MLTMYYISNCLSYVERNVVRLRTFSDFCKDQILLAEANVSAPEIERNEMNVLCINFKLEERRETGAEADCVHFLQIN